MAQVEIAAEKRRRNRFAVELAGGAVELAGGAVELAAAPHPADMTARQAPAIAATTRLRRTRTSPRTSIP